MEAARVDVRYVQISCCPKKAPCPTCGKLGHRKQVLPARLVRTIAYKQVVYLEMTAAEYRARCGCCKTFRSHPEEVGPRCLYDNRVREAVLARLIEDRMSVPNLLKCMRRDFLLDLSEGFVYDCVHGKVEQLNLAQYRQWVVEHFRGTLCVDELHLGRYTLLLATDPLGDFPVAFACRDERGVSKYAEPSPTHAARCAALRARTLHAGRSSVPRRPVTIRAGLWCETRDQSPRADAGRGEAGGGDLSAGRAGQVSRADAAPLFP